MDPMSIAKEVNSLHNRPEYSSIGHSAPAGETAARMKDLAKQVSAKKKFKNRWGGETYPIDVTNYGQFITTLQSIAWIMRDMGYTPKYLTQSGLVYDQTEVVLHRNLFNDRGAKVVALVCTSDRAHFRFSRDSKTIRVRKFEDIGHAVAPLRDGQVTGTKPLSATVADELVKVMSGRSDLNPESMDSTIKFGQWIRQDSNKPRTAVVAKSKLRMEFKKHR